MSAHLLTTEGLKLQRGGMTFHGIHRESELERLGEPYRGRWRTSVLPLLAIGFSCLFLSGCSHYRNPPDRAAALKQCREADILFASGDFQGAASYYDRAIEADPTLAEAYYKHGVTDIRVMGKRAQPIAGGYAGYAVFGVKYFDRAIELNPTYAEAYVQRGLSYESGQYYDKAFADFSRAIELIHSGGTSDTLSIPELEQRLVAVRQHLQQKK